MDITDELEYMCFYTLNPDCEKIKQYIRINNINLNDVDFLRNICFMNIDDLFEMFLCDFNCNYLLDNLNILKCLASCGNINRLQRLLLFYNISKHDFIRQCNNITILNNPQTLKFLFCNIY